MSVPSVAGSCDDENGSITTSMRCFNGSHSFALISGFVISSRDFGSAFGLVASMTSFVVMLPETSCSTTSVGFVSGLNVSSHSGCNNVIAMPMAMITRNNSSQPVNVRYPLRRHAMNASPAIATTNATPIANAVGVGLKTSWEVVGRMSWVGRKREKR